MNTLKNIAVSAITTLCVFLFLMHYMETKEVDDTISTIDAYKLANSIEDGSFFEEIDNEIEEHWGNR